MWQYIENYWDALVIMMAEMAPYLLLGFFFAGLLRAFVPKTIYNKYMMDGIKEAMEELGLTAIQVIKNDASPYIHTTYNLKGQRVTNPQHGIYIQNGKKYIAK